MWEAGVTSGQGSNGLTSHVLKIVTSAFLSQPQQAFKLLSTNRANRANRTI